jgi:hypothetical protein
MDRTRTWLAPPFAALSLLAGCAIDSPALPPGARAASTTPLRAAPQPRAAGTGAAHAPRVAPQDPELRAPASQGPAWGEGDAVSYVIPAVEIVGFEVVLNLVDRNFASDSELYETDWDSIRANLESGWVFDEDPFGVNQLGHPYSGALYHGFARSTGQSFWTSLVYTFGGSLLWEIAGETTQPSLNDQITTGIGGSFLGEAMFRGSSWILEDTNTDAAGVVGASLLCPPLAWNRVVFDRFDGVHPSHDPATTMHLGVGLRSNTFVADSGRSNTEEQEDALGELAIDSGLPGKEGYRYERPFDYYQLEIAATTDTDNHFAHVRSRGLLVGADYGGGERDVAGVYGLYGLYDYVSPGVFRVASTGLGFGTTAQVKLSRTVALQGTALLGAGFGAAGTVADDLEDRDYHYGGIPQGLFDWRLVLGDVAMIEGAARDYLVIGVGSDSGYGAENVLQGDLSLTLRVIGSHALRVEYVASVRDAHFSSGTDERQSIGTVNFSYAYLGASRWGVVE